MSGNRVITIARGYGSGGKTMGQMLAKELGWAYYDRELLRLASDESGINEALFAQADEVARRTLLKAKSNALDSGIIPPDRDDFISNENLFRYQAKIIRDLAAEQNCVIIGRCANYILRDLPNALRIYVHAPFDYCVRTVMNKYGLSQEEAQRQVRDIDRRRGEYYRYFTGRDWQRAEDYDMCIDSSRMTWERCIRIIRACLDSI